MADELEVQPENRAETIESTERVETQKLDDATFEPQSAIEQAGDYKQAEAVQANFIALMDSTARAESDPSDQAPAGDAAAKNESHSSEDTANSSADSSDQAPIADAQPTATVSAKLEGAVASREPTLVKGAFEKAPGGGGGGGEAITPINLPQIRQTAESASSVAPVTTGNINGAGEIKAASRQSVVEAGRTPKIDAQSASVRQAGAQPEKRSAEGIPSATVRQAGDQPGSERFTSWNQILNSKEGFAAVDAVVNRVRNFGVAGAGTGFTDNTSGANTQTGGATSGTSGDFTHSSGPPEDLRGDKAGGPSADSIVQGFYDYCHESYNNGNGPTGRDVGAWVAGQAAEYFGSLGIPGTGQLISILQMMSKQVEDAGKTTVTRIGGDQQGNEDEPGMGDGTGDDEPGTSDPNKGSSSSTTDDDDDDEDDDDDDSDDDGDDGGDDEDEPGEDDGGGDEPGTADGENNDSGHGEGPILKGGGSSGGGEEKDDTGHRIGIEGSGGSGGNSGGGDDSGDDTGRKGGIFGGGPGKLLSDNQAGPIDPIGPAGNNFGMGSDKLNSANVRKQTGKG